MTDPSNVFQDPDKKDITPGTPDPVVPPSVPSDSVFKDQLAAITNERGEQKYDDIPKALEGLRKALREAAARHESVEDVVARLAASQANTDTSATGLDEQKASALFDQLLTQRESAQASQTNQETVQNELVTKFGSTEAANKAVVEKAKELGTSAEELGKLSAQNPRMILELFKSVSGTPSGAPPTPSVNTDGFLSKKEEEHGLVKPEKSLLSGATFKEQLAYLQKVREDVYKKHGVTT